MSFGGASARDFAAAIQLDPSKLSGATTNAQGVVAGGTSLFGPKTACLIPKPYPEAFEQANAAWASDPAARPDAF